MLSKISLLLLMSSITPVRLHRRMAQGVGLFTMVWGFLSIIIAAFECRLPSPWKFVPEKCIHAVCGLLLDHLKLTAC